MGQITRANLRAHWGRYLASIITITLATAFTLGTLMFGQGMANVFAQGLHDQFRGRDGIVIQDIDPEAGNNQPDPEKQAQKLANNQNIAYVLPSSTVVYGVTADGTPNGRSFEMAAQPPSSARQFELAQGHWVDGENQIVLSGDVANAFKLKVGQSIHIQGPAKHDAFAEHPQDLNEQNPSPDAVRQMWAEKDPERYGNTVLSVQVVGIGVDRPQLRGSGRSSYASKQLMDQAAGNQRGNMWRNFTYAAKPGKQDQALAAARSLFGDSAVKSTQQEIDSQADSISEVQQIMTLSMLIFPAIAVVVAAIIVSSTFRVVMDERRRELALLRCIGASSHQLRRSLVAEQLVVGLVASLLGVAVGIPLGALGLSATVLGSTSAGFGALSWWMIPSVIAVGVLITLMAGLGPARALRKISPVAALSGNEQTNKRRGWVRWVVAAAMIMVGAPLAWYGFAHGIDAFAASFFGVLMIVLALLIVLASVTPVVVGWLGNLGRSQVTRLGGQNIRRAPGKTVATAAALAIATGLVSMMMVGAQSMKATVDQGITTRFGSDLILTLNSTGDSTFEQQRDKLTQIARAKGINAAVQATTAQVTFKKDSDSFSRSVSDLSQLPTLTGQPATKLEPNTIYISSATENDLPPQRPLIALPDHGNDGKQTPGTGAASSVEKQVQLQVKVVTDTVEKHNYNSPQAMEQTLRDLAGDAAKPMVLANFDPQLDRQARVQLVQKLQDDYPELVIGGAFMAKDMINGAIDKVLLSVVALLGVSVLVAMIGVANTLILSVASRKREFGLLRALGLTRAEARRMVLWEAFATTLVSVVGGVALGTISAVAGLRALDLGKQLQVELVMSFPIWQMLAAVAVVIVAALIAALIPAARASRYTPIQAIAA